MMDNPWVLILIGVALGMFVIPMLLGSVSAVIGGGAKPAQQRGM